MKIKAFVINREVDHLRLEKTRHELARLGSLEVQRIEAVNGYAEGFDVNDHLPEIADFRCQTPEKVDWRLTAAVFLSHARCWETLIRQDEDFALICEDDVTVDPEQGWILDAAGELGDFDVVFVNDRMTSHRRMLGGNEPGNDFLSVDRLHRLASEFLTKEEFEHPKLSATGKLPVAPEGDGYLLSRKGAEKLLAIFCQNRRFEHADMFLYTMSVAPGTFANVSHSPARYAQLSAKFERAAPLDSYVSKAPIIHHKPGRVGGSVRTLWKRQARAQAVS